jgi:hypothetical protein
LEYFNYLGSITTNDARCARGIKCRVSMTKAAFNKKTLITSKMDLDLYKKLVKCYIREWLCNALKLGHFKSKSEILKSFKMWCLSRMEKIIWTVRVRNEEVLQRFKHENNILQTVKRKAT